MLILLAIAWYFIGIVSFLLGILLVSKQITLQDVMVSLLAGMIGLVGTTIIILVLFAEFAGKRGRNIVLFRVK